MEEFEARRVCECCLSMDNLVRETDEPVNLISICFSIDVKHYVVPNKSPLFICSACIDKINDCYDFRCKILESQIKLKSLHTTINSNTDVKIESDCQVFKFESPIKEEFPSDCDMSMDVDTLISKNQNNENELLTDLKLKREDLVATLRQEIKSRSKAKKRVSKKGAKKYSKKGPDRAARDRERYAESLPYKLNKDDVTCEICKKTFAAHKLLVSHMAVHYPNFICDTCGKPFVLKIHLRNHVKIHEEENVACTICKKVLKASSLRVHLKNHSDDNKHFACPHCTERFPSLHHRLKHMEKFHNVDIYKHQCNFCSKKFHLAGHLTEHTRRSHFKMLNVSCALCDKGFYSTDGLKKHMVKHTGEKNFQCDICCKSFTKKWSLTLHMRTHNGNVKKHKCMHCSKEFTQNGSLKVHIKNIHKK